ncbi:Ectopic P granules protein 5 -like protein [Triplophysa tibetana]|uniref:Ectopic P granules protein 5-like protein n=1 Tax=Triplophysa tibetana TaxID=1572043 RepID=A0A5A9P5T9_9TELE|nr:Ectopic P granules protein 5 -like protein [Triplophysa tibetana]
MEAVRPKKSKSKSSGKSQVKKERQSESVRQPSGPSTELTETVEITAEFTDVPLSLSHVPSTSNPNPPTAHPLLDHKDEAEKDQNKDLLCDTKKIVEKPPFNVESELSSSQAMPPQADQTLVSTQHHLNDQKPLSVRLEPFHVSSIYPSIPACSEPQLLEGLLDSSLLSPAAEASEQRQISPAVLPLANLESSPPSLVPVEVADEERPKERLYPELPWSCQSVMPFTSEQLRMWEPGSWLENVHLHEAEFQSLAHQEGHELYELLLSYWRCRKQLTQAQTELQAANSDCKNVQNRLWSFRDERLSLQGVCADQVKVFGYHCYQQVAVLHRVGSAGDHLFILNHLLCCPAGLGKWAVPFLQIKVLEKPSGVYHFMQALAILMSPVRHRADFLGHMKPIDTKGNSSLSGPASGNWTLVDEGGEEDEDPETSWMLLSEDDLISLFSQFPFDELFKHLLGICSEGNYQPQATTGQKMMKIFAFASSLIELLAVGLQTYNRARYRQFVKRIGHMIRMTLCYVSDHWAQYISLTGVSRTTMQEQSFSMEKLQVEFDHLFMRAVLHVLKAKRLGIWLFMSEMPYGTLSSSMLWKIFYIMQCAETEGLERLSCSLSADDCIKGLKDSSHLEKFENWLSEINSSDGICLLTTFAHMAQPRRTDVDPEFIRTIVLEIYEVSYVSIATREIFSKVGRELLAAIATAHSHIISVLLERLRETIEKVGMVSLYLFKELPLHMWTPAEAEVRLIRDWLLNFSLTAVENRLACIILEGLNWGFQPNGSLVLPAPLHSEIALLVIEAYQKNLTDKPYAGILSEGIKQVSYLANVVRLGQTPESSFNQWAWDLVLSLKLHANERSSQDAWCPLNSSSIPSVPEITDSPTMHPVFKAVKAGIPIGCFLAIEMTTIGNSLEKFCSDGISLLRTLVQSRHLKAAVHILENILPLVYNCQFYLLKNEQFISCIQLFLQLDSWTQGVTQQVTQKVTQHLIGTSTCENIKLLNSVIQVHILESSRPGRVGVVAVLEFWLQVLTEQNLWHRDRAVLFLLDHLCRSAFLQQQEECLQKLLYQQHKSALGYHGDKGLLSSFMGWIVAGNVTPSFIEGNAVTGEVWFAWLVLNMESMFEEDSQLRRCVEHELLSNSSSTPDQALKKAQVRLKLQVVPSLQRLMIYRWAQQALSTPADHPLIPLVWQKFLQLYLRQPGPEFGLEVKGCIGRRYFQNAAHLSLLKSLRQRLVEVSDFHHAASKALKVPCFTGESSDDLLSQGTPVTQFMTSPELHTELVRLFNVFALWLDDENLQKQDIYLPSLPKQYDTHRLAKIMQRQQEVWIEHVDIERVQHELQEVLNLWSKVKSQPAPSQNTTSSIFTDFINPLAARERILTNLRKHDAPQGTLLLVQLKAPVPDIPTECFSDEKISTALIQKDLAKLQHQAKLATVRETQQVALDNELLEVLPQLYINREDQLSMQLECRGKGGEACQGPAHITVKYSRMHKLDPVENQIQCLKNDIKQLQADGVKPPPQSLAEAAVHTENFITALVNAFKLNPSPGILKVGIAAFYQIVSFVCEDTQRHPPTRQFFTSCIEILGQVFIRDVQSECKHMLKTILINRHLCNLLSPYFTPNASPPELVSLYEEVVNTLHSDSGDVIFMLLTKFDVTQWLSLTHPAFSERSQLMAIIHQALCTCGLEPEAEVLMPFNIFCKHWTELLLYQFPDHYSDFLRLLMQSSSEQLLSPDCWRASLKALGCTSHPKIKTDKTRPILLSAQQVDETIEWLSKYFLKLRLSNGDFRSFGLLSKWAPYIEEVKGFWENLIGYVIDLELNNCSKESVGSPRLVKVLENLHAKMAKLFQPWILDLNTDNTNHPRCSPWLESDSTSATSLVSLYTHLIETLHEKSKDRLLPGQRGALWLHLMHYCETCTSPKMPEYLLYTYHTEYSRLPWKDLHPDQSLMNQFFNVERGSPKSCFLFMGEVLCEVNWVSALSDAHSPHPSPSAQTMVVSLLYLMVFLAKEDLPLNKPESSVLNLLSQSVSLPWHLVDFPAYQNVTLYVSTHYPASLVLSRDTSSQQVIRLLRMAAGFEMTAQPLHHKDMTLKCQAFLHIMVQFLTSLDQNGNISLASLETEMERLLEYIVLFNPPETDPQQRHMAICSLFAELLTLLNEAGISTAEGLGTKLHSWVEKRARGPLVLPLLTAACRCLASVRHMARATEACILSYFADGGCTDQYSGWGPILVSLQVPELTVEDFIQESLNLGSYLTLYIYILQRLNLEQTLLNEKKTLVLLNTWINQGFPGGPADEAKLFLWWHKVLELLQIQVDQEDTCELDTLIITLMAFQNRLAQLGEERLNSGILGAIGLGKKSPLSSRFRVIARSMSAFLLVQVPSETQLRLRPGTQLQLSSKAQQALAVLEAMPSNKQYSELQEAVSQACQFVRYPGHCLRDSNHLLTLLVNTLYTDLHYLDIIR